MSKMEKLPKLVSVYEAPKKLQSRQLPLMVDENLTLVMDIKSSNIISDSQVLNSKELNEFANKMSVLSEDQFQASLQISKDQLMEVLNQTVPCIGCRKSVERLYYQLVKYGHPTLDPIVVKSDGIITLKKEKQQYNILANIFHDHGQRLETLIETQPKRNKKSVRCLLHSLDSQRTRPLAPVWRDVWDSMRTECRKDICIIEASCLLSTLENYLRKHRFCVECRTKVRKAYLLLVEEPEPTKEKGYVSSLYSGIKRCLQDKHIHLSPKTEYISKLINRAEPELLGRERHAKTLEIAQEEVLTCLGICMYERLHRVYMRVREEERTCQLFAAVAVHTLNRSFETVVERVRGVSQLQLLYEEFTREEQAKQKHKEAKKIRRKRRKGKLYCEEKENCCGNLNASGKDDNDNECSCSPILVKDGLREECECSSEDLDDCDDCSRSKLNNTSGKLNMSRCSDEDWLDGCKCESDTNKNEFGGRKELLCKCDNGTDFQHSSKKESGSSSENSHDCGYNTGCCETGSLTSSLSSSPELSELACSDSCCQPTDFGSQCRLTCGGGLSLQEMLEVHSEDDEECYITAEEVREFKSKSRQVYEKRRELRETLQKRFAQFCHNGVFAVPRLLVQTKYASN